jgi:thioredoxin reductase
MGLIRNAVTQGRQAADSVAASGGGRDRSVYDLLVVGAGPAGLSATLQAQKHGLRCLAIDQDDVGGTILTYPRQKLVMTQPMDIPVYGKFSRREVLKEELLELWHDVVGRTGVDVRARERLEDIRRPNGRFEVITTKGAYPARNVLLAIGRRGTPRKLGVPGESSAKVTYRLLEPEQYRNKRILVVGGGDSAVETALALGHQSGATVTLSYRKPAFSRIKEDNGERIQRAAASGAVALEMESEVERIDNQTVTLRRGGDSFTIDNDYVFVLIGGELPTPFLRKLGVDIETKFGEK